jgi:LPS export ABC transporter protein LptC
MNASRRTRLLRRILVALIVVVCAAIGTAYLGYRHFRARPAALVAAVGERADLSMDQVRHTATRDGRTEWVLEARRASLDSDSRILRLEGPRLRFFPRQGGPIDLEAERGRLHTASNDIEVEERVVVKNVHYRLDTQSLNYDHARARVTAPGAVEIRRDADLLRADSLTVHLQQGTAELAGAVKGIFRGTTLW